MRGMTLGFSSAHTTWYITQVCIGSGGRSYQIAFPSKEEIFKKRNSQKVLSDRFLLLFF